MGILFESPPTQEMSVGIASGMLGYQAVVEYAIAHPDRLISTVETARRETIELGLRAEGAEVDAALMFCCGAGQGVGRVGVRRGEHVEAGLARGVVRHRCEG